MSPVPEALARLHDIRPAPGTYNAVIADFLTMAAAGLLIALLAARLLHAFTERRARPRDQAFAALEASRALAPPERLLAQARVLRQAAPPRPARGGRLSRSARRFEAARAELTARLAAAVYSRDSALDPEKIDRDIAALLRRMRS